MNKRIRELAAQADEYATEKAQDGFSNYNLVYDRKFAELIVRECMIVGFNAVHTIDDGCYAVDVYQNIKEHFGVEE